jgi:hypothetical protein
MRKAVEHCVVHHRQPPKFQSKICDVIVSDSTLRRIGALVDLTGKNQGDFLLVGSAPAGRRGCSDSHQKNRIASSVRTLGNSEAIHPVNAFL